MQDIHPDDGLNEIEFYNFMSSFKPNEIVGELDEGVLDQLIQHSKKLAKLNVIYMPKTSEHNR